MSLPKVFSRLLIVCLIVSGTDLQGAPSEVETIDYAVGGCGGVYFLASPGQLTIDVYKQDRNRSGRTTELRAILVAPDRQVLDEVLIPDDGANRGSPGPWQHVRLTTDVKRTGVYGLNITVSQDRYGDEIAWGFQTNCPKYLIETSRGHRDERRREPIVLRHPSRPGKVCFLPPPRAFAIEISGLAKTVDEIQVLDANDQIVGQQSPDKAGTAAIRFLADPARGDAPWQIRLPSQQATIHIDGVTQWEANDRYANLPCWTPDPESFFPLLPYRWLLTPYHRTVHRASGEPGTASFRVHNNSEAQATVDLSVEFPEGAWPIQLSTKEVTLAPGETADLTAFFAAPAIGEQKTCHIRAAPKACPEFTSYSTLVIRSDEPKSAEPLEMPITLKAYQHENQLFGYAPDYPTDNQVYFDPENRPYIRDAGGVAAYRDGKWQAPELSDSVQSDDADLQDTSCYMSSSKIAFDTAGDVYVLGRGGDRAVLFRSSDGGKTYAVHAIPGAVGRSRTFDIEQPSGHNTPKDPPPILQYTRTAVDPKLRWRRVNDLHLILAEKRDDRIVFADPILISRKCIGLSSHSGIPSSVVSRGSKVHVAWGEATEPSEEVPGVPTYVATYDRETKQLSEPALVGYGPPANDVHNSPSITIDSRGYLHVLCGTHGQPFPYAQSRQPNTASGGWTDPVPVGGDSRQTYLGLVCGADDSLHLVFRMWQYGQQPHPHSHHATLAYQRKRPGQPWEAPRVLVVAPFSEYSIFYHRLTIDRLGRLFLSYDYWSTYWFYRTDHYGDRRLLIMSPDGGDSWKLAETTDLVSGRLQEHE